MHQKAWGCFFISPKEARAELKPGNSTGRNWQARVRVVNDGPVISTNSDLRETRGASVAAYASIAPLPAIPSVDELTYRVPESLAADLRPGMRVLVPLGRRRVTGLVTKLLAKPPAGLRCRDIESLLDVGPILPGSVIELARWMSGYYLSSLSEALSVAIGKSLSVQSRQRARLLEGGQARGQLQTLIMDALKDSDGSQDVKTLKRHLAPHRLDQALASLKSRGAISLNQELPEPQTRTRFEDVVEIIRQPEQAEARELFSRAPRRREIYQHLLAQPDRRIGMAALRKVFASPAAQVAALEEAGLLKRQRREVYRRPEVEAETDTTVELTQAQREAVGCIEESLGSFTAFLLHGVTASGKTEVYMRIISRVLERGASALVLVPEISLTHQVVGRLLGRFGPTVAVLHSELSAGQRWDEWRRLSRGEARVAVGARSAVMAPLEKLGLVVVDEEHDGSYKQSDGLRYHGRDVAVVRAKQEGCPVILASATPSIESWHNALEGRYQRLAMDQRIGEARLPRIEVVDLRGHDITATGGLSDHLTTLVKKNFADGGQTLLFLNRRGYSGALQCYECGCPVQCKSCSVAMTIHRSPPRLACHHCDSTRDLPASCPACGRDSLVAAGLGTEKVEAAVRRLLPEARVARLDRDSTTRKGSGQAILGDWRAGRLDLLVGTQMIAKGHDAPGVNLVGVLQADMPLGLPDFRACERTFQLLCQVAGRAGRAQKPGRVVVQTYRPDHFAIHSAVGHDYQAFAKRELDERKELGYPPHCRMTLMRFEGPSVGSVRDLAGRAEGLLTGAGLTIRGPAPAPVERLRGRYRYQIQLRSDDAHSSRLAAARCRHTLEAAAHKSQVRIIVDVDPVDML
jgi:primosomal protein N' (replication factor Y)